MGIAAGRRRARFVVCLGVQDSIDASIAAIGERHHGIFNATHLSMVGVGRAQRTYRLTTGRWVQVYERVYRIAGTPVTLRSDLISACWAGGTRAVVSHRSAAFLHDLPGKADTRVEITCPHWRRAQHDGLLVHESRALPDRDITLVDGIPVTTVDRTIFDLCSVVGPRTVDFAIDNALRRELTTVGDLVRTLRRLGHRGVKGTQMLRRLLAARDAAYVPTESEREQMLLDVIRSHGLPEPRRQHVIRDELGQFVARVDLAYPDPRIAIEYDSYQEHVGKQQLVRDSRRRNAITALGWRVLAATAEDVRLGQGHALASAINRARGLRPPTGVKVAE